jgi:hypothetical protein
MLLRKTVNICQSTWNVHEHHCQNLARGTGRQVVVAVGGIASERKVTCAGLPGDVACFVMPVASIRHAMIQGALLSTLI